jgi:small subunit ribosomal protein S18
MGRYKYNNKKTVSKEVEIGADGLKIIRDASDLLYLNKDSFSSKRQACPLTKVSNDLIDFRNFNLIRQFVSERGKILPSRVTNVVPGKQRKLRKAIKIARVLALLPFENKL